MKSLNDFQSVYIHRDPVDMRKAINGLSTLVEMSGMGNLFSPSLFVFAGKRRDVIKILYFDRSGFLSHRVYFRNGGHVPVSSYHNDL